jgi:hypothetical protein
MSRMTSHSPNAKPGRTRMGLRFRGQHPPGARPGDWACPQCGLVTRDAVAVRLGYCAGCRDFTGMCGAGRKIFCADIISVTAWHTPCTSLGTAWWQIIEGKVARTTVLCPDHDAQLRSGGAPWVRYAIPLEDAGPGSPG